MTFTADPREFMWILFALQFTASFIACTVALALHRWSHHKDDLKELRRLASIERAGEGA